LLDLSSMTATPPEPASVANDRAAESPPAPSSRPPETRIDVEALRARIGEPRGAQLWRSLEEVAGSDDLARHFPRFAAFVDADRRQFLKLMSGSLALAGLAGCTREPDQFVPYVTASAGQVAGEPRFYATANTVGGLALGVLVESNMGRPTKVEGNPLHPASLGGTDIFAQASVLDFWDPDRSRSVTHEGKINTWEAFDLALQRRLRMLAGKKGEGLRVLTDTVSSPTLAAQMRTLLARYPNARWHRYSPINRDNVYAGSRLAFGEPLDVRHRFDRALVVLSLDADFLDAGGSRVRDARDFVHGPATQAAAGTPKRLYAITSTPCLTSAFADHAVAVRASEIEAAARSIAELVGVGVAAATERESRQTLDASTSTRIPEAWLAACARDLAAHRGTSLVVAGDRQPAAVHALAHAMNAALGNVGATVAYADPVVADSTGEVESLKALAQDLHAGAVDTLVIIGGNPVYCAPADVRFAAGLSKVAFSIRHGLYEDETSARCQWHLPATHYLESWSDARAFDGTVTIVQPLIAPLYEGRSAHELVARIADGTSRSAYAIVREYWQSRLGPEFEQALRAALRDGIVPNTAVGERTVALRDEAVASPSAPVASTGAASLELMFVPDPSVYDGSFANNAWLQELPRPLTKLTWDNAALIAPALARRLGLGNGDVVELQYRGARVNAPVWIMPGHPDGAVSVSLGYGRTRAGRIGDGHGFDAYALRTSDEPWFGRGLTLQKTGKTYPLATTQHHHSMEGRDLVRTATLSEFERNPGFATAGAPAKREGTLYAPFQYDGYKWGMAIDLGACIGCNACTIACQAENNIPVVGKEEVARGREMHWIRVDRYYQGAPEAPRTYFQPVPCMQCQRAPCEVVCPVEASVHDSEGINVQVYNRCVGTRFCSNNCPYKVRRFNFLQYTDQEIESLKGQRNPEVTVRIRGVMEKCNYCLQRIANGRIEADKANRRIQDGEVVTACQAVCPTRAITFGDLNDPSSGVNARKASPLNYALLAELNTEPRTTYLASVSNPNPELG
jgi:molybdopterin-containing oxidoreductase family iron-sulfur binding subunit